MEVEVRVEVRVWDGLEVSGRALGCVCVWR